MRPSWREEDMHRAVSLCLIIILVLAYLLRGDVHIIAMLAMVGALIILNGIYDLILRRKVEIRCRVDGAVRKRSARIDVVVQNHSRLPIPFLSGRIRVENTYTGESSVTGFTVPLAPMGENLVAPEVEAFSCGKYTLTVDRIRLRDIFGIFAIPAGTEDHCNFTVVPELFETSVEYDLMESETFDNETYSPYKKGQDRSEVFQIREYKEGDPLNQIHWKLTSKLDKPVVKDPSLPISRSMAIVFDKSDPGTVPASVAEAMAEMLVSVGEHLIEEGLTFRLMWNDTEMRTVHTRDIQFEDEFAEAIPRLLTGRIAKNEENLAQLQGLLGGSIDASHVIYICPSDRVLPDEVLGSAKATKLMADTPGYRDEYREIHL